MKAFAEPFFVGVHDDEDDSVTILCRLCIRSSQAVIRGLFARKTKSSERGAMENALEHLGTHFIEDHGATVHWNPDGNFTAEFPGERG